MTFPFLLHTFLIGIVCGLRSMTAPAVVSWAAYLGWLDLSNTTFAFLGYAATPYILSVLALGELVVDKLPGTPSRKAPPGFIARVVLGTLSACALALGLGQSGMIGALLGAVGAIVGTLGGYEARTRLVKAVGMPLVIALIEDAIAIAVGLFVTHHNQRM